MSEHPFKYIVNDPGQALEARLHNFHVLSRADSFVFVKEISDCLNAERNGADAVIWNSDEWDQLEELSPKKRDYGWMLVSLNIPIYVYLTNLNQIEHLSNIHFDGFYADDVEILIASQKKMETLSS